MSNIVPESTGWVTIPFYYHKCKCGKRLVHTFTVPCSVCIANNEPQETVFMGNVRVRVDKEGFLKAMLPLRVRE